MTAGRGWSRVLAVVALASTHCAARPRAQVCGAAGSCPQGRSCLVGLCRLPSSEVVPPHSRRIVLGATQAVVLCASVSSPADTAVLTWPAPSCRRPTVLLRFDAPWGPDARVAAAFLVVGPADGSPSVGAGTVLEVAAVREPWSAATVAWRAPELGTPNATARSLAVSHRLAHGLVRIDVTNIVASWARRTLDDNGVALTADVGEEATLAWAGSAGQAGPGPRLDVYLR